MEKNNDHQGKEGEVIEPTIFSEEEFPTGGYDKRIRHARIAIFVIAGSQLLAAAIAASGVSGNEQMLALAIYIFIAAVFIGLGFWSKRKPYKAIVIALCLYVGLITLAAIDDPATLLGGWIIKIIVIIYMSMGINDARDAEREKAALGQ